MKRLQVTSVCLISAMLTVNGQAFAHGNEKHSEPVHMDAQMQKLHAMMPVFSVASAGLESALEKGDIAGADSEAGKMLEALPDLKKSRPHKHIKQRSEFVRLASDFEAKLISVRDLARKGEFKGAKSEFKKLEAVCAKCHARFR
ncbi:MAG: hypothetical protein FPO08_00535 [Geobacter sp.]|nr:MAG: hypothetical protein FPO08_00535 [Geobacter sp.]